VSHVAIVARVTVKEGRAGEYVAAFEPLLDQAKQEPGTLLYALHRSKDDPHVFWTTEVYAADAAFAAHRASEVHAAASPVFTELIAAADVLIGETLICHGLERLATPDHPPCKHQSCSSAGYAPPALGPTTTLKSRRAADQDPGRTGCSSQHVRQRAGRFIRCPRSRNGLPSDHVRPGTAHPRGRRRPARCPGQQRPQSIPGSPRN
jgi:(4S)-4-hydroxy-5-phosphonooxypentane-2,3-dione isomerase